MRHTNILAKGRCKHTLFKLMGIKTLSETLPFSWFVRTDFYQEKGQFSDFEK